MEDTEDNLLQLVRTYDLKSLKNKQQISALWNVVTQTFNKATGENYTKKQLQKRLSYINYKEKRKELEADQEEETPIQLQEQIERSLKAKKIADEIESSVENVIAERLKIQEQILELNKSSH